MCSGCATLGDAFHHISFAFTRFLCRRWLTPLMRPPQDRRALGSQLHSCFNLHCERDSSPESAHGGGCQDGSVQHLAVYTQIGWSILTGTFTWNHTVALKASKCHILMYHVYTTCHYIHHTFLFQSKTQWLSMWQFIIIQPCHLSPNMH